MWTCLGEPVFDLPSPPEIEDLELTWQDDRVGGPDPNQPPAVAIEHDPMAETVSPVIAQALSRVDSDRPLSPSDALAMLTSAA